MAFFSLNSMETLEILYRIIVGLSTEAIIRVIDSHGEIKEKLTSFLMKLNNKKSSPKVDLSEFNLSTRMVLNDNNEYVFR